VIRRLRRAATTFALCALTCPALAEFSFDVDDDGDVRALTDGLLVLRFLFGFEGDALAAGAVSSEARRSGAEDIRNYLRAHEDFLDINGDGKIQALTDGLLLIRAQFGFKGEALIAGAVTPEAHRATAIDILDFLSAPYSARERYESILSSASWGAFQGASAKFFQVNEPQGLQNSIEDIVSEAGKVFGGGEIHILFFNAGDEFPPLLLNEFCRLIGESCDFSKIAAIESELATLTDYGYDFRTLIVNYEPLTEDAPLQILFLERSDDGSPNERLVNAVHGLTRLYVERQLLAAELDNAPEWWIAGQADYLAAKFLSEVMLGEPFDNYLRRISDHLRGFAANKGPVSALEAEYREAGASVIAQLVSEHNAAKVFLDFYNSDAQDWETAFKLTFAESSTEAATRIAEMVNESFELAVGRDPNDLLDSLKAEWRIEELSAETHFDLAPIQRILSIGYQQLEGCPYTLLMESHEFGDFNGDGYPDLVFTLDENNYWNQSSDKFCSAGTRVIAVSGALKGEVPTAQVITEAALGARDTVVADINQDGFDDLLVVGAGHKNETYAEDSPSISKISFFLGSNEGLIDADDLLINETLFTLADMTAEGATYGDIDNDGVPEFLMFGTMRGIGWPRALLIDCQDRCVVKHPKGYKAENHLDTSGTNIYNTEILDINNDGLQDILFNAFLDPDYFDIETNYLRAYSNFGYLQNEEGFDFSVLPEELDFGFRLNGLTGVFRDDGVEISPEATHFWETEMVDLDKDGLDEFVALENNQFHVLDDTFVISVYSQDETGSGFELMLEQPEDLEATHDQNFQFIDLDNDGDLDIISTLHPFNSGHSKTIALHENLNPGWSLSMKGYAALMQEFNCNRIYVPDFDADGDLDVVITCPRGDAFEVYYAENRKR